MTTPNNYAVSRDTPLTREQFDAMTQNNTAISEAMSVVLDSLAVFASVRLNLHSHPHVEILAQFSDGGRLCMITIYEDIDETLTQVEQRITELLGVQLVPDTNERVFMFHLCSPDLTNVPPTFVGSNGWVVYHVGDWLYAGPEGKQEISAVLRHADFFMEPGGTVDYECFLALVCEYEEC